jgi:hypothetical protein
MLFKVPKILAILAFTFVGSQAAYANCTATGNAAIATKIGAGHAYGKHVVTNGEFVAGKVIGGLAMPSSPVVNSVATFQSHIQTVMASATTKALTNGRKAWWYATTGTIVIYDPKSVDCGTAFRPANGKSYYDSTS